jgi:hypothetical protein
VEDGSPLHCLVLVEGKKREKFQRSRMDLGGAQVLFLLLPLYLDICLSSSFSD